MTDLRHRQRRHPCLSCYLLLVCLASAAPRACWATESSSRSSRHPRLVLPVLRRGFPGDTDEESFIGGMGREFDLFDTRGGVTSPSATDPSSSSSASSNTSPPFTFNKSNPNGYYPTYTSTNRVGGRASSFANRSRRRQQQSSVFDPVQRWWTSHIAPHVKSWPTLSCKVEPTTTLKIRKTFRPIGTIVRLGADFNTQLGVWQFKSSWEDAFLGGKLTLAGRELQLTKSWQLSVGAVEDLVTRLRFRAAVDLQTWKAYVRVGFRTERLSPINVMEGFTILKQVPLDGTKGHVKLEVKANLSLPEPEIEYSTETQRSLVGMGDIEISVEELNLVLDY